MSESQFVDFCPSIKPNDHKYNDVVRMLKHNGCLEENSRLTKCLQDNKKNFAKCTQQNQALGACVKDMRAKNK